MPRLTRKSLVRFYLWFSFRGPLNKYRGGQYTDTSSNMLLGLTTCYARVLTQLTRLGAPLHSGPLTAGHCTRALREQLTADAPRRENADSPASYLALSKCYLAALSCTAPPTPRHVQLQSGDHPAGAGSRKSTGSFSHGRGVRHAASLVRLGAHALDSAPALARLGTTRRCPETSLCRRGVLLLHRQVGQWLACPCPCHGVSAPSC